MLGLNDLRRLLDPLLQRIKLLVGLGIISLFEEVGGHPTIQAKVLDGETAEGVKLMQHYGFASRPLPGAEALIIFHGGERSLAWAVATDDPRVRPLGLLPGEVVLFNASDELALDEELPEVPEGYPEGWPAMPEGWPEVQPGEEDPPLPPPLCRIQLLPDRTIQITGTNLRFFGLEQIVMAAPSVMIGQPGGMTELGGESGHPRLARVGDCVEILTGSSAGKWPIVESCD